MTAVSNSWVHRKNAENFARLIDYQDELARGALRYDVGERSNFALVPAAEAGIRQLLDWGVENIQETVAALTGSIAERAPTLGLESVPEGKRAGHCLGLKKPVGYRKDSSPNLLSAMSSSASAVRPSASPLTSTTTRKKSIVSSLLLKEVL